MQKSVWYNNSLKKDNVTWLSLNICFHYAAMQFEIGKYWSMSPYCSLFKLRRYSLISGLPAYSCLERSRCCTIPGITTNFLPRGILISPTFALMPLCPVPKVSQKWQWVFIFILIFLERNMSLSYKQQVLEIQWDSSDISIFSSER